MALGKMSFNLRRRWRGAQGDIRQLFGNIPAIHNGL
jgi:hypothetical protein